MKNDYVANELEEFSTEVIVQGMSSLSKEVKESAVTVTRNEARFLVDTYYQMQQARIAADGQIRSITQGSDDNEIEIPLALKWVSANMRNQEAQIKKMLEKYVDSLPVGRWALATKGIGPILAAGCLSYFDINKVNHYGQFLSYCGLNDYNNPWLGTEKAKKLANDIYNELKEADELVECNVSVEYGKKVLSKLSKCDNYGAGKIAEYCSKDKKMMELYNDLMAANDGDIDATEDYIIRKFINPNAVTEVVIVKTAAKTKRTRAVVVNGLYNMIKNKNPKAIQYTKTHLAGYLAKPPYNIAAKQLIYLIGEAFVKVSGKPDSLYGRLYRERKAYENTNNENGVYKHLAEEALTTKNYGKDTASYQAYIEGKLPPTQIHRRSKRYAVRIFISHLFEAMYMDKHKCKVPHEIYPMAYMGHTDYIGPEVPFEEFIKISK